MRDCEGAGGSGNVWEGPGVGTVKEGLGGSWTMYEVPVYQENQEWCRRVWEDPEGSRMVRRKHED